jgi:hypothetical protein
MPFEIIRHHDPQYFFECVAAIGEKCLDLFELPHQLLARHKLDKELLLARYPTPFTAGAGSDPLRRQGTGQLPVEQHLVDIRRFWEWHAHRPDAVPKGNRRPVL